MPPMTEKYSKSASTASSQNQDSPVATDTLQASDKKKQEWPEICQQSDFCQSCINHLSKAESYIMILF